MSTPEAEGGEPGSPSAPSDGVEAPVTRPQGGGTPRPSRRPWWKRWRRPLARWRKAPAGPTSPQEVEAELGRARAINAATDTTLRRVLGYGAPLALIFQIGLTDYIFYLYGSTNQWRIDSTAIDVWLAATVVQLAIITRVIGKYLFPPGGPKSGQEGADRP